MSNGNIQKIIDGGEGITVEFKKAQAELNKAYTGIGHVEFVDDDLFVVRVPLGEAGTTPSDVPVNVPVNVPVTRLTTVVSLLRENPKVTIQQMARQLGVNAKTIGRDLGKLRRDGLICRVGPDKNGHWEVASEFDGPADKAKEVRK